jgi:hypothetical protein
VMGDKPVPADGVEDGTPPVSVGTVVELVVKFGTELESGAEVVTPESLDWATVLDAESELDGFPGSNEA